MDYQATLNAIRELWSERGIPPTVREVKERTGASSTSVVAYRLRALEREGRIQRVPKCARGIILIEGVN
jgi:repressor LexA